MLESSCVKTVTIHQNVFYMSIKVSFGKLTIGKKSRMRLESRAGRANIWGHRRCLHLFFQLEFHNFGKEKKK